MDVEVTYYTVADSRFFPGLVALLNSLRLTGNGGKITVLDRGLEREQRTLLAGHVEIVQLPEDLRTQHAWSVKPYPALLKPRGIIVVIDSDIIVTRNLEDVTALAQEGKICVFPDPDEGRFFSEWEQLCDLSNPPRRQTYVNSGFVALSAERWDDLLRRWWMGSAQLPPDVSEPLRNRDQDVLNALLMSEVPREMIAELPGDEVAYPTWQRVTVNDTETLTCIHRERATTLLHYDESGKAKPWERRAWLKVRRNAYVQLMPRLLFGADVTLPLPREAAPIWLRTSAVGRAALRVLSGANGLANRIAPLFPKGVRRRMSRLRHR